MFKVTVRNVRMHISGHWSITGSAFRQDRQAQAEKVETRVELESDAEPAVIAAVLRNCSNGCYAEQMIRQPVPIEETFRVNGQPFRVDDYPATVVRRRGDR